MNEQVCLLAMIVVKWKSVIILIVMDYALVAFVY